LTEGHPAAEIADKTTRELEVAQKERERVCGELVEEQKINHRP